MGEETDRELLKEALSNAEAIAVLYDRYRDRLFAHIFHTITDRDLAEDMTEAVFAKMVENLPWLAHGSAPLLAWLCRVSDNEMMTWFRHRHTETRYASAFRVEDGDPDTEYDMLVANVEMHTAELRALIGELTSFERSCLVLRYKENMKPKEIAGTLECTAKQVSNALHHACRVLREKISANPELSRYSSEEEVNTCRSKKINEC